jgi:hypothetical protein
VIPKARSFPQPVFTPCQPGLKVVPYVLEGLRGSASALGFSQREGLAHRELHLSAMVLDALKVCAVVLSNPRIR